MVALNELQLLFERTFNVPVEEARAAVELSLKEAFAPIVHAYFAATTLRRKNTKVAHAVSGALAASGPDYAIIPLALWQQLAPVADGIEGIGAYRAAIARVAKFALPFARALENARTLADTLPLSMVWPSGRPWTVLFREGCPPALRLQLTSSNSDEKSEVKAESDSADEDDDDDDDDDDNDDDDEESTTD
jgi:hypothetical protein